MAGQEQREMREMHEVQERRVERVEDAIADAGDEATGFNGHVAEGVDELSERAVARMDAAHGGAPRRTGLLHLYCGDGKGKTTAAVGLALRALGHGRKVTVVEFLKDGTSGEVGPLTDLGAVVYAGKAPGFVWQMTKEQRDATRLLQTEHLKAAMELENDLLVLDEACAVWNLDMVDRDLLKKAVLERPEGGEVVLTGRDPADWMTEAADYMTEMRELRHPYERGVQAREGVEY